jgi:hypothetical protein
MSLVTAFPVTAQYYVTNYNDVKNNDEFIIFVNGVGEGLAVANAKLRSNNQNMLYCAPTKLVLKSANYMDILNREIKRNYHKYKATNAHIELILLYGLENTFPCQK